MSDSFGGSPQNQQQLLSVNFNQTGKSDALQLTRQSSSKRPESEVYYKSLCLQNLASVLKENLHRSYAVDLRRSQQSSQYNSPTKSSPTKPQSGVKPSTAFTSMGSTQHSLHQGSFGITKRPVEPNVKVFADSPRYRPVSVSLTFDPDPEVMIASLTEFIYKNAKLMDFSDEQKDKSLWKGIFKAVLNL